MPKTDSAPMTPRPTTPTYRNRIGRRRLHVAQPSSAWTPDRGLAILVDDGDPTLAYTGYRLYAERDRYLIRAWHKITNEALVRAYIASLRGDPLQLIWTAFGLRSWDDVPEHFGGFWGAGDAPVTQDCTAPLVRAGLLLPPR
ncbi:hypothetical protein [Nocardiopsis sp. FR26]|uniref:hypothetical protein n=1 Tax=Nocardiopsis sp. FR26 TaxID=2605987 RepID=UPI001358F8C6|nr:hypothetical protein [Nocardiopsis sp. FR26]